MNDEMNDEYAIRQLLARYCQLCDEGRFEEMSKLFTDDVITDAMGTVCTGRDGIIEMMERVYPPEMRGIHALLNPLIEIDGAASRAHVSSILQFVRPTSSGPILHAIGRCVDDFVCLDGRWLIAKRTIRITEGGRVPSV